MTLCVAIFSITIQCVVQLNDTQHYNKFLALSGMTQHNNIQHNKKNVTPGKIILSITIKIQFEFSAVIKPFMLSFVILNVIMLSAIMLSVIMLSVIMLSVIMLSVIMLSVKMLSVIMLNVIILSVIMLSVIMLSVIMLSV
jgi:hypothetical protein